MSKVLLVVAAVLFAAWLWRSGRRHDDAPPPSNTPPRPEPQAMARCDWCAVHLPLSETVAGQRGRYCCAEHRQSAEP